MKYVKAAFDPQSVEEALKSLAVPKYMIEGIHQVTSSEFNICVALRYKSGGPFRRWIQSARKMRGYYNIQEIEEGEYTTLTQNQPELELQKSNENFFEALVLIKSDLCDVLKVADALTKITGVKDVTIHFGPFDISILVQSESANDFGDKFIHQIQAVEGIREATAYPVYKRIQ